MLGAMEAQRDAVPLIVGLGSDRIEGCGGCDLLAKYTLITFQISKGNFKSYS